ncbi:MAG: FeoB-associated Cys-rich membrane protein [Eubacteriales bacterium]|nr:FeoB-associated Cys-rich membrane protein [Eubacteriales bacterium]
MLATIITGVLFAALVAYGLYRTIVSSKNNSCAGCSGGCSVQQQKNCKH